MAAGDDPRVGPAGALDDDVRIELPVEPGGLRAGRGVADEDHRPVLGAQPALGGQAAQPRDPLVAELVVGPLGGRPEDVRDAVAHPREGRRVVEVGDGDVRVAADDRGAVGLHLAQDVDRAGRVGAVEDEVAGDRHEVRLLGPDRLADRGQRDRVAVDVREHDDAGHRRTPSPGMMKLSVASQAVSPSTLATPAAAPEPAAELLHRDLEPERVTGADDPLEAAVVDRRRTARSGRRSPAASRRGPPSSGPGPRPG